MVDVLGVEGRVREVRADSSINIMRRRNNGPVFITNSYDLLGMQLELVPD